MIFDYPEPVSRRRHGPRGYKNGKAYRPWLRDEFLFRCVYCLKRETWGQVTGEFELDHFEPRSIIPMRRLDYFNLVYSCRRCNAVKRDQRIIDPMQCLHAANVVVLFDGSLDTLDDIAERTIRELDLNSPRLKKWRVMWMRITQLAEDNDPGLHAQLVGFPDELPDLGRLRPRDNLRRRGIEESWFARRQRGELPDGY